jgi:hypothetical protein
VPYKVQVWKSLSFEMSPPFLTMDVVLQNGDESRVMAIASANLADDEA